MALTVLCFWQVCRGDFVNFDDQIYIVHNPMVSGGLSSQGFIWAFTTGYAANYHPLTWLSLMADVSLHGLDPHWFHAVNLALHVVNVLLLYQLLRSMTGSPWRALLAASVFAIHPLRVESVAWITERKDVLSMFFGLLALLAYVHYARRPGVARYLIVALLLLLSLLSKAMLVTFPFLLLLLDYWPFGRLAGWSPEVQDGRRQDFSIRSAAQLIVEKVPLLVLVATFSILTFEIQRHAGAIEQQMQFSFPQRLANAAVAYASYVKRLFWPRDLAVLYPLSPNGWPTWVVTVSAAFLVLMTGLVCWRPRQRPWLAVGWFWFLGLLVPVIGLVQVGGQSMADRYTYLPTVGLLVMVVWSLPSLMFSSRTLLPLLGFIWLGLLAALGCLTHIQVGYWLNSETLFRHTLAVTHDNWRVESGLGSALAVNGRVPEAIDHFRAALVINPHYLDARMNLALALRQTGQLDQAATQYETALRDQPDNPEIHGGLGVVLAQMHQYAPAAEHLKRAAALDPDDVGYHANLGRVLTTLGQYDEAAAHLRFAYARSPNSLSVNMGLGLLSMRLHQPREASGFFAEVVRLSPDSCEARLNWARALAEAGQTQAARDQLHAAELIRAGDAGLRQRIQQLRQQLGGH